MHEKLYNGGIDRLRAPERVVRLEVERVISLCLEAADLKSVLDVGVGSGLFAEEFSQRGLEVAGVDVNPNGICTHLYQDSAEPRLEKCRVAIHYRLHSSFTKRRIHVE